MCSVVDRTVWDCLVPAAIREDIELPELHQVLVASFDSDNSQVTENRGMNPYERAFRKREIKKNKEVAKGNERFMNLFGNLLDPSKTAQEVNPPEIYFELHNLPKSPTWSEKEVDNEWLPSPPSFACDEYKISQEKNYQASKQS